MKVFKIGRSTSYAEHRTRHLNAFRGVRAISEFDWPFTGSDPESVENFYVALLDGNLNLKGEIYYHNEARMLTPYSIYALPSGGCLVSTGGNDRHTFEQQHAIYKLSDETIVGIEEAHDAGFAVAVAYPNPGKDVLNIRTALQNAQIGRAHV